MPGGSNNSALPRWELESIYPGYDSEAFTVAKKELRRAITGLIDHCTPGERDADDGPWLEEALRLVNAISSLYENLESYCYCRYSVETGSEEAAAALNAVTDFTVSINEARVAFRNALASLSTSMDELGSEKRFSLYGYILTEEIKEQRRQMSVAEETLAADLNRAGGDAWSRLQSTLSSQLTAPWDDATGERRSVVELRALAKVGKRDVRRKAYELEIDAWKRVEVPLAFALNGVKGFSDVLNRRRGWESTLARSTAQARMTPVTLTNMVDSMEDSLPLFRRYLKAKARTLGLDRLAFYDIFAPLGEGGDEWSYSRARSFIVDQLSAFSNEMGSFADSVFDRGWIDAEPRTGKVGGAYCIDMPENGQTRILANFDGSFDSVTTLAHELGHAYHAEVLRDLPPLQRQYPMTLAETASLFSETLVFSARAAGTEGDPAARARVLESYLQGATQVVVDILSRYRFESRLMERRREAEVSPRELNEYMLEAQEATYGDALDPDKRHPYMWAVKGHYYNVDLAFYNFPYAFGLLFALGLYAEYRRQPEGFPERYRALLRETGRSSAESVGRAAGFDISGKPFWEGALAQIESMVTEFEEAAS